MYTYVPFQINGEFFFYRQFLHRSWQNLWFRKAAQFGGFTNTGAYRSVSRKHVTVDQQCSEFGFGLENQLLLSNEFLPGQFHAACCQTTKLRMFDRNDTTELVVGTDLGIMREVLMVRMRSNVYFDVINLFDPNTFDFLYSIGTIEFANRP
jgi:hypothetical protein